MKDLGIYLLLLGFALGWLQGNSQNNCGETQITLANQQYLEGRFEMVSALLQPCLHGGFDFQQQIRALRLLALNSLAQDSTQSGLKWGRQLIELNPTFVPEPTGPIQFIRLMKEAGVLAENRMSSTVSKRPERNSDAPATVIIIDGEEINRRGYTNLEQIFSDLPGFDVSRTYGITQSNIYMRGYRSGSGSRFVFMIDGIEANDIWTNTALISQQYPMSNIKRIEVAYGPASAVYGANAVQGVVNVITKKPQDLIHQSFPGISYSMSNGTYSSRYADLTIAAQKADIGFTATFKRFSSFERSLNSFAGYDFDTSLYNGIDYIKLLSLTSQAAGWAKINNPGKDHPWFRLVQAPSGDTLAVSLTQAGADAARSYDKTIMLQGVNEHSPRYSNNSEHSYFSGQLHISELTLGFEMWKYNQGALNWFTDQHYGGWKNGNNWVQQQSKVYARFEKRISDKLHFNSLTAFRISGTDAGTQLVYVDNYSNGALDASDLIKNKVPAWNMLHLYQMSKQFKNEANIHYKATHKLEISSGVEFRRSALPGSYRILLNPSPGEDILITGYFPGNQSAGSAWFEISEFGLHLNGTYYWNEWLSSIAGGRFDYNYMKTGRGYGAIFNPRLALVAQRNNAYLKAMFSSAHQNYANDLEYFRYEQHLASYPDAEPERMRNLELSAGYWFTQVGFFDATVFHSWQKDYEPGIAGNPSQGIPLTSQQATKHLEITGFQSNIYYKLKKIAASANYTWCRPRQLQSGSEDRWLRIADMAAHRINLSINALVLKKLDLNLRMNYASKRATGQGTTVPENTDVFPATSIFHATLTYNNLQPGLNLQFIFNNVFDKEYSDPGIYTADGKYFASGIPQHRFTFNLRVSYNLRNSFK